MALQVKPGQWVQVKVVSQPKREAAVKTLRRLFEQDPEVRRERTRMKRSRPIKTHIRGGRVWKDRPSRLQAVKTTKGASHRIFASISVIRDLNSLGKHVEVTPA